MKNKMKPYTALCGFMPGLALTVALAAISLPAHAAITMTNTANVTLAASQVETGGDLTDNPEVTGGLGGPSLAYTATSSTGFPFGASYGASNLNDGDIGVGIVSDGTYAITTGGTASLTLDFGSPSILYGISIYNGYNNRDDGTYTLRDGSGNLLGAWTITTALTSGSNDGTDSFWLTFNTPVTTTSLVLDTTAPDSSTDTNSYREIQVFVVPEPSSLLLGGLGVLTLLRRRRA